MVKLRTDVSKIVFRPKISEASDITGWNTQDATRNEVPAQKASVAVPPRSLEIASQNVSHKE